MIVGCGCGLPEESRQIHRAWVARLHGVNLPRSVEIFKFKRYGPSYRVWLWPPLILEIMMMAKRRNDEDDNAIRRHFSFKLDELNRCIVLFSSLVAEGFT